MWGFAGFFLICSGRAERTNNLLSQVEVSLVLKGEERNPGTEIQLPLMNKSDGISCNLPFVDLWQVYEGTKREVEGSTELVPGSF